MGISVLGEMLVKYKGDISDLSSKITQAKSDMSSMSGAVKNASDTMKTLSNAAKVGNIVSDVDVAKARLQLIESKAQEARQELHSLQGAADLGQAVTGLPEAESKLTILEGEAQKARQQLQNLQNPPSTGGFFSSIKNMAGGVLDLGSKLGQTAFGLQSFGQTAIGFGNALLGPNASMEQTQVAFQTLLGKGKATQDFLGQLQQFAAATPFEFPELATDAQHMVAFGFSAKDVIPYLTNIGDAMGSMGKSNASIDHVVQIFGQMHAASKLNAGDMMQLSSEGIPVWKMLADSMHKTVPEVQALSSKGLIPADQAIKAVSDGMHKMFGGGMAAQAQTFNGQLSTVKDNASAAMRAFTGPLFDMAKQGLGKLGDLVSSPGFQQFATTMGKDLAGALTTIGGVIGPVVDNIGKFVGWLQQGSPPATAVGIALLMIAGGFAAIQIGAFIAAVPALVAGFIAWSVAAWSAAIATIAATWPLFLIGAAVVAVVAIIILAVKNWGAIVAWLKNVWGAISGWFIGIWNAIKDWVGGFFSGLGEKFHGFWDGIVNFVKGALQRLWDTVTAPFRKIGDLFIWLYEHNKYFSMLVDAIRLVIGNVVKWLQDTWHNIITWITDRWNALKDTAMAVFNLIYLIIQTKITQVKNFVQNILTTIGNFFRDKWNDLAVGVYLFWVKIHDFFANAWSRFIQSPIGQIFKNIADFFTSLPGKALQWGQNLIQGFINGITNMAGGVKDAIGNIAGNIGHFLGFHSPTKEGPGKELDLWGPNMVKGFSQGIDKAAPALKASLNALVQPMVGYPIRQTAGSSVVVAGGSAGGSSGSQQGQTFILEVDGVQLAKVNANATDRLVRLKLGANGRAA